MERDASDSDRSRGPVEGTVYRPFDPERDTGYVLGNWLSSYLEDRPGPRGLSRSSKVRGLSHQAARELRERERFVVRRILGRSTTTVVCHDDDPDGLVAFVCSTPGQTLHYVYVSHNWRTNGIMTSLLDLHGLRADLPFFHTYRSFAWDRFAPRIYPLARHHPGVVADLVGEGP